MNQKMIILTINTNEQFKQVKFYKKNYKNNYKKE